MEDIFYEEARMAEIFAKAEARDWGPDWVQDWVPEEESDGGPVSWAEAALAGDDNPYRSGGGGPGVDPGLDDADPVVRRWRVDQVVALRTDMARLQALEHRHLAVLAATVENSTTPGPGGNDMEVAFRSLTAELAVACRVSVTTMQARLSEAHQLVNYFPATLQALQEGRIGAGHARTICLHGGCIEDPDTRARYEGIVLQKAALVPPGRLARYAELTAARIAKVSFEDRHKKAREARYVRLSKDDHGMSTIVHYIPTLLAAAVWDRLTQQAKAIHHDAANNVGDPRTFDQIRADLATELLLIGQPSGDLDAPHKAGIGIRAEVSVVIPALSLLGRPTVEGANPDPAMLAGHGPIGMDEACALAADAPQLVRILTHPVTGMVLGVDNYRPSKKLRRFLRARDGRCRFPACNRNPRRCDIDHTFDWEYGGKTKPDNLECLCRGDHTLKHKSPWKVRQITPGVLEWTSPLGRVIIDLPDTDVPGSTIPF